MAQLKILDKSKCEEFLTSELNLVFSSSQPSEKKGESLNLGIESKTGQLIAALAVERVEPSHNTAKLNAIAVSSSHQRKGYATVLFNFGVSMLKAEGFDKILCDLNDFSDDFFLRQGFTYIEKTDLSRIMLLNI